MIGSSINSVRSVTVINPGDGRILLHHDILINDGRITSIRPSAGPASGGFHGANLYAIPGLIDTHVHALNFLFDRPPRLFDLPWVFRQQRKNLAAYLRSGVTTIRDMAAPLEMIKRYSLRSGHFEIESPKILFAGPIFTVTGGYPYFLGKVPALVDRFAGKIRVEVSDETYARQQVDAVADAGAACVKIGYQSVKYDDGQTAIPAIPLPLLRAVVDQAHRRGLPAAVHCCYRKDLRILLDAADVPFDSLEHIVIDDTLGDEEIDLLAKRRIPVSTTLMTYGMIDHRRRLEALLDREPERFEDKPREFLRRACAALERGDAISRHIGKNCIVTGSGRMRENLKKMLSAGITIAYATDSAGAITPAGCPHWELLDMARAGMKPLEALRAATSAAADAIGLPGAGRLEPGKSADIVLLEKNPLDDLSHVAEVSAVIRDGRLVFSTNATETISGGKFLNAQKGKADNRYGRN